MSAIRVGLLCLLVCAQPLFAVPPAVQIQPLEFKPDQAERVVLSNGVVVFLKEDHELPLFDMNMRIHVSPPDQPVPDGFAFFGDVWRTGGTVRRTPDQLNEELESMPASIETAADDEALSISVSCLSRDMDKSLKIFQDVLLHPAFRDDQIALERSKIMEAILRKNETPTQIARRAFRDVAFGKDHLYAYEPTPASIKQVSRRVLLEMHRRAVVPDQAVLAVAGDFNREQLLGENLWPHGPAF